MFSSLKLPKNLRLRSKQQPQPNQGLSQNQLEGGPPHLDLTSVAGTKPGVHTSTVVTTNRRSHKWSIDKALCPGFVDRNGNDQKMLTTIDQNDCSLITNLANYGEKESQVYPSDSWSQSNYGQEDVSVTCKLTHVCIERDISGSLGITLRGGVQSNPENNMPLVITQVRPNGPADREGTIKVGDRLISVDGRPLHSVTLSEAQTILKDSGGPVSTLTIEYNVSNMDHLRSSHGTLLVEVNTTRPHSLGLTLVSTRHNSLVIGHVKVGSIAERCGAFMPGDQSLSFGWSRVEGSDMTASDVYSLLWHPKDSVLLIEVLTAPTFNLRGYGKNKWYTTSTPTLSSPGSSATRQGPIYVNHCKLP
ncbi:hypothetical protein LSTR_LSTR010547 [Laodelphax striatellus]|uniref:PDZ domain-containing protein n=1 Tax=Laodelphax striatellus TaxID=195883 RepID=A0A482WL06_LAOST|nr:hypothetical protein LSTR_LSTR010547 [Laodelphax striatellus]